jgi:hypothetical protein
MPSILAYFLILVPAPATEPEPTGSAPTLQYVRFNDKGVFEQTVTIVKYTPVTKSITVNVNGKMQVQNVTEVVPTQVIEKRLIDAKGYDFYDLDGKRLDEADWKKALSGGAVVAVAADGNVPHAAYRKVLKAGTIIMVGKAPAPIPMKLPPPAP